MSLSVISTLPHLPHLFLPLKEHATAVNLYMLRFFFFAHMYTIERSFQFFKKLCTISGNTANQNQNGLSLKSQKKISRQNKLSLKFLILDVISVS